MHVPLTEASKAEFATVEDLLKALPGIPTSRIRITPQPGTATEADVLRVLDQENRICELIDGTLVEKAMGYEEARLAGLLLMFINVFLMRNNLGLAAGPDGTMKLTTGLVRIPDVSFVSWGRLPGRKSPDRPIPRLRLDLAVEILSRSNSKKEMSRKLREYFEGGVTNVWFIDPKTRTARVFRSPSDSTRLTEDGALDGGTFLPGFHLPLRNLFGALKSGPEP